MSDDLIIYKSFRGQFKFCREVGNCTLRKCDKEFVSLHNGIIRK